MPTARRVWDLLLTEHRARLAALDDMEASVPDLNAVMMVRVSGDVIPGGQVGLIQLNAGEHHENSR